MKSTAELFKNNELTTEAIKKILEACDESAEYIKGDKKHGNKGKQNGATRKENQD